jgi:hypothetical protein
VRLALQARLRPSSARQKSLASVGVSPPTFSFLPVLSVVIRAEAKLAHACTGIGLLHFSMEHRMKSVVTSFKCVVA